MTRTQRCAAALGRRWRLSLVLPLVMITIGCQTYEEAPIDVDELLASWSASDADRAKRTIANARSEANAPPSTFDLADGITLAEAETTALFFNPSLCELRARLAIERTRAEYAGRWRDPELDVDGESILESVKDRFIWSSRLNLTIPLSRRVGLARDLAAAQVDRSAAELLGAEWAIVSELRRRWIRAASVKQRIEWLEVAIRDLDTLVAASARYKAARAITVVDERLLLLERATTRATLERLRSQRAAHALDIIELLGLPPKVARDPDWNLLVSMPTELPTAPDPDRALAGLVDHPEIETALASYAVTERALALAVEEQIPDLRLGLGLGHEDGAARLLTGIGLAPLPIWNRNAGNIAARENTREFQRAAVASRVQAIRHRLARWQQRFVAGRARLDALENDVAPLVAQQLRDARRLTRLGQVELFALVDAVERSRVLELSRIEARAQLWIAATALHSLVGPFTIDRPHPDDDARSSEPAAMRKETAQ